MWVIDNAKSGRIVWLKRFVRTKKFVPNDENTAVVFVEVGDIAGVVHLVDLWGVEEDRHPAQGRDQLGVEAKLVGAVKDQAEGNHGWIKAQNGHPQPKYWLIKRGKPAVSNGDDQIEGFAGMVRHMGSPQQSDGMAQTMMPIKVKIISDNSEQPDIPRPSQGFVAKNFQPYFPKHLEKEDKDG